MSKQSDIVSAVLLDLDYTDGAFELVLANSGPNPVFDVSVEFSHPMLGIGGTRVISDLPLWKRLTLLRPAKEIRVFFDSAANVFRKEDQREFTATVRWRTGNGAAHEAVYEHSFDTYRDMPQIASRRTGHD